MERGKLFLFSRFFVRLYIGRWTVDAAPPGRLPPEPLQQQEAVVDLPDALRAVGVIHVRENHSVRRRK